jgi:hypothetical protein
VAGGGTSGQPDWISGQAGGAIICPEQGGGLDRTARDNAGTASEAARRAGGAAPRRNLRRRRPRECAHTAVRSNSSSAMSMSRLSAAIAVSSASRDRCSRHRLSRLSAARPALASMRDICDHTEVTEHVQTDRSPDPPGQNHPHLHQSVAEQRNNRRDNDKDRYVLAAQSRQLAGAANGPPTAPHCSRP